MAMELMTEALKKKLPLIAKVEDLPIEEVVAQIKFFHPLSGWEWYVVGGDPTDHGDILFYGVAVTPHCPKGELGYFYLSELQSVQLNFGPVTFHTERDKLFTATKLKKVVGF